MITNAIAEARELAVAEGDGATLKAIARAEATYVEHGALSAEGRALLINMGLLPG